ncbi:MAG: hypothetical protein DCF15_22340 [Phormidesmis priestleyi]|uniref:Uncharacterized protein n=1 Tax=Phormidesmis priestleyi TaxID=268141 RepID=A0A2W4WGI2_9CYAN|nr:MAG: hypothetical protein DCF15_22340 [Phormidesmis priestleyi]
MVVHSVLLRGLQAPDIGLVGTEPTLLTRADQDPIAGVLADLIKPGLTALKQTLTQPSEALYQPVHRIFHLVLLEAVCDLFATGNSLETHAFQPKLDPLKIDSAGLVLRRYALNASDQTTSQLEGWRTLDNRLTHSNAKSQGWTQFSESFSLNLDPDPKKRDFQAREFTAAQPRLRTGALVLDRQLSVAQAAQSSYCEQVTPLFIAPPEVCQALNKTILYGLVPLTSQSLSEAENTDAAFDIDFVKSHLPSYLQATSTLGGISPVPDVGRTLTGQAAAQLRETNASLDGYLEMLRQVSEEFELGLLTPTDSIVCEIEEDFKRIYGDSKLNKTRPASIALCQSLDKIKLDYEGKQVSAGDRLKSAAKYLLNPESTRSVTMPTAWGEISDALGNEIAQKVKVILDQRLSITIPQFRRFDDLDRTYSLRAFIRVKSENNCLPYLHWSAPSQPFTIRPWYAASPVPPVQVALPDILGPNTLKTLKPNVAFNIPAGLFNAIDGMTLKDLLAGKKPSGSGPALNWICGFNIPIITICAFIVLNIFLQLLNFIFGWLPFIKVCIPIPTRQPAEGGN